jgi:L-iditol 2-dehydrogenase
VRALVHQVTLPSVVQRRLARGRYAIRPPFPALRLKPAWPDPVPPDPSWVRLSTVLAGMCGSDVAALAGTGSPLMLPLLSFPSVPGHEILARVDEPAQAGRPPEGERVVVDPFLSCPARGQPPCPACQEGRYALCHRALTGEGSPGRGMMLGFHRLLPGGWGQRLVAHPSQLHLVPPEVPDEVAVLTEPLAVALHGVRMAQVAPHHRVLVIGAGTIGLATLWALGEVGVKGVDVVARHPHQARLAKEMGGHPVTMAQALEGSPRLRGPWGGALVLGSYHVVFDAVGSPQAFTQALEAAWPGGKVVRTGETAIWRGPRGQAVWAPEVQVVAPLGYGLEELPGGERVHTFDLVLRALRRPESQKLARRLLTHRLPLDRYAEAWDALLHRGERQTVKVVLDPQG